MILLFWFRCLELTIHITSATGHLNRNKLNYHVKQCCNSNTPMLLRFIIPNWSGRIRRWWWRSSIFSFNKLSWEMREPYSRASRIGNCILIFSVTILVNFQAAESSTDHSLMVVRTKLLNWTDDSSPIKSNVPFVETITTYMFLIREITFSAKKNSADGKIYRKTI